MSLSNFSMAKNFQNVNDNNNEFEVAFDFQNSEYHEGQLKLDNRNYATVTELATNFATKIGDFLVTEVSAVSGFTITGMESISKDNIITFILTTTGNHGMVQNNTTSRIRFVSDISDSYMLLGGNRMSPAPDLSLASAGSSVTVSVTNATSIKVTCLYPAQTSTTPFIYIRAPGVQNTNIETRGLRHPTDTHNSDTAHSDILGRAVVESNEWIQFTQSSDREFFLDIHQKQLNVLRLRLTDSKNRLIGRRNTGSNTASGTGLEQSTLGNLSFSAVLRFDIVKSKHVHHLETQHHEPNIPARFSEGNVPIRIR